MITEIETDFDNEVSAMLLCDFYKLSHRAMYPPKTQVVYSTWTPRASRVPGVNHVVAFGFQGFIKKYLIGYFNKYFFNRPKDEVIAEYKRVVKHTLGDANPYSKHIEGLHDLGYLPLEIVALPEGILTPLRVPMLAAKNTHPDFFWLTNYIETLFSCEVWLPSNSATIAHEFRKLLNYYAKETGGSLEFVPFQGHDFSMRGMGCLEAAKTSGAGHLLSFTGTDTIPAICYLEKYYGANIEKELVGTSIPASEHSTMCAYGKDNELDCYERFITEVHPKGFVSIVSDTWDLWDVLTRIIAQLKPAIMDRDGKVVIRPDSGDPVKIICGDPNGTTRAARAGVMEVLWDIFSGTVNEKGYKQLDSHIGCIYGDAITYDRCRQICEGLKKKGFASTNMVFGIGSYTYQYNTRDTFGFAFKSTMCVIDGKSVPIFKDPKTDDGVKKSQKGIVRVYKDDKGEITYEDELDFDHKLNDMLELVFVDGKLVKEQKLSEIRARLRS